MRDAASIQLQQKGWPNRVRVEDFRESQIKADERACLKPLNVNEFDIRPFDALYLLQGIASDGFCRNAFFHRSGSRSGLGLYWQFSSRNDRSPTT